MLRCSDVMRGIMKGPTGAHRERHMIRDLEHLSHTCRSATRPLHRVHFSHAALRRVCGAYSKLLVLSDDRHTEEINGNLALTIRTSFPQEASLHPAYRSPVGVLRLAQMPGLEYQHMVDRVLHQCHYSKLAYLPGRRGRRKWLV